MSELSSMPAGPTVAFNVDVKASSRFPWLEDMACFTDSYTHALKIVVPRLQGVTVGRIWLHVEVKLKLLQCLVYVPDKEVKSVI